MTGGRQAASAIGRPEVGTTTGVPPEERRPGVTPQSERRPGRQRSAKRTIGTMSRKSGPVKRPGNGVRSGLRPSLWER